MEITRIAIFEVGWHTLQEFLLGSGNDELKKVSKSFSFLKCHFDSLPNEREGMSVIVFWSPAMWRVVSGQLFCAFIRNASTRSSCSAIRLDRQAIRCTQLTVGLLSLNSATLFSTRHEQTCSIISHKSRRPASSRSELVIFPLLFLSDMTDAVTSGGHWRRNTVGGHSESSPIITPPAPKLDASQMPT